MPPPRPCASPRPSPLGLLALLWLSQCRGLVGVDGKDFSPEPAPGPCAPFASAASASLRFTHAAPTPDSFDLCLLPASGPAASLSQGQGCSGSLRFGQRSARVRLPAGRLRAWAAQAGQGCDGARLAEGELVLGQGESKEVVLTRQGQGLALVEVQEAAGAGLRLLNAVVGADLVEVQTAEGVRVAQASAMAASGRTALGATAALELTEPGSSRLVRVEGPVPESATAVAVGVAGDEVYAPRLLLCDDRGDGGLSDCRSSPLAELRVETLNAYFNGEQDAFQAERLPALLDALRGSPADVLCLQELLMPGLRQQVAEALAPQFPYAVFFVTDESMPINSEVPADPLPTTPVCAGFEELVDQAMACAAEHCSTLPGDQAGRLTGEVCFLDACGAALAQYYKSYDSKVCTECVRAALQVSTMSQAAARCTAEPGVPMLRGGDNDLLLLSRHPVDGQEAWILPSTRQRRPVLRATVRKPESPALDVYCTRLGTILDGTYDVYYGAYGGGSHGVDGWAAEQRLQAQQAAEFMILRSPARRALLAGWMGASREVKDGDTLALQGFGEASLDALELFLLNATPPAQRPECTACRANPLYDDSIFDRRTDHVFLRGFDPDDVASVERVYTKTTLAVSPSAGSKGKGLIPISDHYGLRATVRLTR